MGRYYSGDIEGKFWFGVQSSTDADYFGVQGHATHLNYYFQEKDKDNIKIGISECERYLQGYKKKIDEFFELNQSYNDEMLLSFLKENGSMIKTEGQVKQLLEWYARLYLGEKILNCVEKHGHCSFEAEL